MKAVDFHTPNVSWKNLEPIPKTQSLVNNTVVK